MTSAPKIKPDWISLQQAAEILIFDTFPVSDSTYASRTVRNNLPFEHSVFLAILNAASNGQIKSRGKLGLINIGIPQGRKTVIAAPKTLERLRKSERFIFGIDLTEKLQVLSSRRWQAYGIVWERNLLVQWEGFQFDNAKLKALRPAGHPSVALEQLIVFGDVQISVADIEKFAGISYQATTETSNWGAGAVKVVKRSGKKHINELADANWTSVFAYIEGRMHEGQIWDSVSEIYGEVYPVFWKGKQDIPVKDTFRQKLNDEPRFGLLHQHVRQKQKRRKKLKLNDKLKQAGN